MPACSRGSLFCCASISFLHIFVYLTGFLAPVTIEAHDNTSKMVVVCSGDFPWTPCRLLKRGSFVTIVLTLKNLWTASNNLQCSGRSHYIFSIVFFLGRLGLPRFAVCSVSPDPPGTVRPHVRWLNDDGVGPIFVIQRYPFLSSLVIIFFFFGCRPIGWLPI